MPEPLRPDNLEAFNFTSESQLIILSGAGISAESGLKTFRGAGGLWEGHRVEEVATPEAYAANPDMVVRFYNERRKQLADVGPNRAHHAIGELQASLGDRLFLVTQNVDDLHERGGASQVCHMHGELKSLKCLGYPEHRHRTEEAQEVDEKCPGCWEILRPDIVWFGEMPYHMDMIQSRLLDCTHFIYTGTSSNVYPAAGFKDIAKQVGATVLCINLEVDKSDRSTDYYLEGKAGEIWPEVVKSLVNPPTDLT